MDLIRWDVIATDGKLLAFMWASAQYPPPVFTDQGDEEVVVGIVRSDVALVTVGRPRWTHLTPTD